MKQVRKVNRGPSIKVQKLLFRIKRPKMMPKSKPSWNIFWESRRPRCIHRPCRKKRPPIRWCWNPMRIPKSLPNLLLKISQTFKRYRKNWQPIKIFQMLKPGQLLHFKQNYLRCKSKKRMSRPLRRSKSAFQLELPFHNLLNNAESYKQLKVLMALTRWHRQFHEVLRAYCLDRVNLKNGRAV